MKLFITLLTSLTLTAAQAQEVLRQQTVSQTETAGSVNDREAIDHLTASNLVERQSIARYVAGQSVTLRPGFTAQAGSVFKASIASVSAHFRTAKPEVEFSARAYPNPFQQNTKIEYVLPKAGHVSFTLVDEQGRVLQQQVTASSQEAGRQEVDLNLTGAALREGVYFYQIRFNNEQRTIRLLKTQ